MGAIGDGLESELDGRDERPYEDFDTRNSAGGFDLCGCGWSGTGGSGWWTGGERGADCGDAGEAGGLAAVGALSGGECGAGATDCGGGSGGVLWGVHDGGLGDAREFVLSG